MSGEVVPPILPADDPLIVDPPHYAGPLAASHEALRAERDTLHDLLRGNERQLDARRAELVVVRQALTDLLARYDPVHRARAVLAGTP